MGIWAASAPTGIRAYLYTTSQTTNPTTYKTLDKPGWYGVHSIGEVWAEMLYEVTVGVMEEHGSSSTLFPPPINSTAAELDSFYRSATFDLSGKPERRIPKHGNTLMVQ